MLMINLLVSACALVADDSRRNEESVGLSIQKFTVSRDDSIYECFPSLARLKSGRIVLVYRESNAHVASEYSRLVVRTSDDNGRTFSAKHELVSSVLTDGRFIKYNCPKVQELSDGRVLVVCDAFPVLPDGDVSRSEESVNYFWFSSDQADTWSAPVNTGVGGIMPDEVVQLDNMTWLLAAQVKDPTIKRWIQRVSRSEDAGKTWSAPIVVAAHKELNLCEGSILKLPGGELVCYMREESWIGLPIYKSLSADGGRTWKGPYTTQMECGHRPVAHLTKSGKVLITYRHTLGGASPFAKNFFAYLESPESALEPDRNKQSGVVLPLDHDRNPESDGGYSGWVETSPGEFLAVSYIKDDAPMAQLRGYRFKESDF